MRLKIIIFVLFTMSCVNYDNDKYILIEDEIFNDLILELSDAVNMIKLNEYNAIPTLYLLDTIEFNLFNGYYESLSDSVKFTLRPFLRKNIKGRKIEREMNYDVLNVKKMSKSDFNELSNGGIAEYFNNSVTEIGIIIFSRVIINETFNKGYFSYTFYCGSSCSWGGLVETKKINGKWMKVKEYGGFIS